MKWRTIFVTISKQEKKWREINYIENHVSWGEFS
jgi:hypothetical protein